MTADADCPADVREIIMDALADETVRPDLAADAVLAALSSAGRAVVPAEQQREEFGVQYEDDGEPAQVGDQEECPDAYADPVQLQADMQRSRPGASLWRRTVYVGRWVRVEKPKEPA